MVSFKFFYVLFIKYNSATAAPGIGPGGHSVILVLAPQFTGFEYWLHCKLNIGESLNLSYSYVK